MKKYLLAAVAMMAIFAAKAGMSYTVNPASMVTADTEATPWTVVYRDGSGNSSFGALTQDSAVITNNASVGGALGVTGVQTNIASAVFRSSVTAGYLVSNGSMNVALNGTIGGTLGVTGVQTNVANAVFRSSVTAGYFAGTTANMTGVGTLGSAVITNGASVGTSLGVGVTSPEAILDVRPANTAGNAFRFYRGKSGGYQLDYGLVEVTEDWGGIGSPTVMLKASNASAVMGMGFAVGASTPIFINGATAAVNIGIGVNVTTITAAGAWMPKNKTKAQFATLDPIVVGEYYYCSDCTIPGLCVSSGTAAGDWRRDYSATVGCQE